jgi:predicted RNase H-like HicB family nuclease
VSGPAKPQSIVIEKTESNYSAYVPDLPCCVATGGTLEQVELEIRQAIEFHIDGLRDDGFRVCKVAYVNVNA